MLRRFLWTFCLLPLAACGFALAEEPAPKVDEGTHFFATKVQPLLKQKCYGCHGDGDTLESEFDMRTRAGLLKGGEIDIGAVEGKPEESPIYQSVLRSSDLIMPPKERNALNDDEVAVIKRWIEMGLPWADGKVASGAWDNADGVTVKTSGGLDAGWTNRRYQEEDLWAFLPMKEVAVPDNGRPHPIDAFLQRRLDEKQITPAAPAEPRIWLRRITFDLTGLPPTPEEVQAFDAQIQQWHEQNSKSQIPNSKSHIPPSVIEATIDRLLASKHYGERMAQHWLDVVRYADTSGFANDWERPNAWRYRDYVIRSFNADTPYNRFVIEQIAGDELPGENPELDVAVGFLRMGPWEQTAMSVAAVTRQQFLDDVTNSVGVTFLAQGMSCCKCHDHKFDPLPTRDYYRMQAVFAPIAFDEAETPFLTSENTKDFDRRAKEVAQLAEANDWMEIVGEKLDSARRLAKKRSRYMELAGERFKPQSFSVKSSSGESINILKGGSLEAPGEQVSPGVLSAVRFTGDQPAADDWDVTTSKEGRRLELAKWIAHEDNPLTARVIVNRVWQMHFGTGLVNTPSNFGKMGGNPTHPELLDWLAGWFVENGWSIKKLHRLILTSDAYARSSTHQNMEQLREVDPKNKLLAYFPPRRLTAEEIRDAMLAVTGELNDEMGGPPIYPEINWEVALQPRHIMGGVAPVYQPSPVKSDRDRRTVYASVCRTLSDPMLEVLNRPGPDLSCERRDETTVTPQVFALFNSENVHTRALALALRLEKEAEDTDAQITRAYELVFSRQPTEAELQACQKHVAKMIAHHQQHEPPPRDLPVKVAREMVDEQTGKPFKWQEKLHWLLDYERDTMPWEVSAETRGLAELCLVLLNANEFVYVY